MAKIIGKDTYLSDQKFSIKLDGLLLVYILFIAVITFWVYVFVSHFSQVGANIDAGLLLILYFILKKPIETKLWLLWRYRNGQTGEEKIRHILQTLSDAYMVFENIVLPEQKSNIDFVVVGPSGVCAVEVKSHKGNMTFEGNQLLRDGKPFEKDVLRQAKGEAISLGDYINCQRRRQKIW